MKKNYEKYQALFTSIFIIMIIYIIFIEILFTKTFNKYILISSVVRSEEYVEVFITTKELKYLKSSKYVYIKDKKYKREIIEVNRNVLKKDKKNYHEVKIKIKLDKNYKVGDNITLRVIERKEKIYMIFKSCWKE